MRGLKPFPCVLTVMKAPNTGGKGGGAVSAVKKGVRWGDDEGMPVAVATPSVFASSAAKAKAPSVAASSPSASDDGDENEQWQR